MCSLDDESVWPDTIHKVLRMCARGLTVLTDYPGPLATERQTSEAQIQKLLESIV